MKTIRIEVLGPGCRNCDELYNNVRKALEKTGTPKMVTLEKKQGIDYFIKMGVFSTPALVIDGKVVSTSRVLNPDQITDLFQKYGIG